MTKNTRKVFDLTIAGEEDSPAAYAECIRIARRLRTPGYAPIGLVPAPGVEVEPVAMRLAAALVDLSAQPTALVYALARSARRRGSIRWLRPALAVITPEAAVHAAGKAAAARAAIARAGDSFRHILVDLSGLEALGELQSVLRSVQRIAVVASARATRETEVLALARSLPAPKQLGVMLVG